MGRRGHAASGANEVMQGLGAGPGCRAWVQGLGGCRAPAASAGHFPQPVHNQAGGAPPRCHVELGRTTEGAAYRGDGRQRGLRPRRLEERPKGGDVRRLGARACRAAEHTVKPKFVVKINW